VVARARVAASIAGISSSDADTRLGRVGGVVAVEHRPAPRVGRAGVASVATGDTLSADRITDCIVLTGQRPLRRCDARRADRGFLLACPRTSVPRHGDAPRMAGEREGAGRDVVACRRRHCARARDDVNSVARLRLDVARKRHARLASSERGRSVGAEIDLELVWIAVGELAAVRIDEGLACSRWQRRRPARRRTDDDRDRGTDEGASHLFQHSSGCHFGRSGGERLPNAASAHAAHARNTAISRWHRPCNGRAR